MDLAASERHVKLRLIKGDVPSFPLTGANLSGLIASAALFAVLL